MSDLEKVITGLECCSVKQSCSGCPWMGLDCNDRLHLAALELLKSQPEQKFFVDSDGKITPLPIQPQWISVKDRLPGTDEDVLILYESKVSRKTGYAITCLKDSFYFGSTPIPYQTPQWNEPWQYFRENNVIIHWMPLPEPPEVEQDD